MKLTVKTLTGKEFQVQAEPTNTVGEVKVLVAEAKPEFPAEQQKLIFSGKVLKDDQVLSECGVTDSAFLVVMIAKGKKPAAAAAPPTPTPAPTPNPNAAASPQPTPATQPVTTPSPSTAPQTAPQAPQHPPQPTVNDADLQALMAMGFPEGECRAALEAAARVGGGQELAVEFLATGIPANFPPAGVPSPQAPRQGGGGALAELRNHPQFDQLRQLVQSNPAALETVLQQIGQQSPQLLQLIRENTQEFLQMINEPVAPAPQGGPQVGMPQGGMPQGGMPQGGMPQGGMPQGGMPGMLGGAQLQQMANLLQQMPEAERTQLAQSMGLTPEMLQQTTQLMAQMPPEQLNQLMAARGLGGMPGGMGGMPGGPQVIQLSAEDSAAVTRLTELGFSQQEAAEAYLACDRNEALAANFLFDSGSGGFGGFGDFQDPPAGGGNDQGGNEGGDDEDMYS